MKFIFKKFNKKFKFLTKFSQISHKEFSHNMRPKTKFFFFLLILIFKPGKREHEKKCHGAMKL